MRVTPWVPVCALLLAIGSVAIVLSFDFPDPLVKQTFAICNANRHVGLALMLAGNFMRIQNAVPAVACYAVIAPIVMVLSVKLYRMRERKADAMSA